MITVRSTRTDERPAPYKDMRDANQYSFDSSSYQSNSSGNNTRIDHSLLFVGIVFLIVFILLSIYFYPPKVLSYVINIIMWFSLGILAKIVFSRLT